MAGDAAAGTDGLFAGLMEKIMTNSKDASTLDHDTLADRELDAVSGGAFPIVGAQMALLNSSRDASEVDLQPLTISKLLD
jgi:hypothetical protein